MRLLLAASALMLALSGCSSDQPTDTATTGAPTSSTEPDGMHHAAQTHDVHLVDNAFVNQTVTIMAGDRVRWTHQDGTVGHTVTADDESFDSHPNCLAPVGVAPICMEEGETYERPFDQPGTVGYNCKVHPGMTGTIVVEPHSMPMAA